MKVLSRRPLPDREGCQPREVILAQIDNGYHPFVTWQRNIPERGGDGGTYWGHYFASCDFAKAMSDFYLRGS